VKAHQPDLDRASKAAGVDSRGEAGSSPARGTAGPVDTALYIADLSGELAQMARQAKLDLVAYLLDLTRLEAARTGQRLKAKSP
jgi:hypothetical protein